MCRGGPFENYHGIFKREEQTPADRRRGGSQTRRHPLLAAEEPKPLRTNKEIAAKVLDLDQSLSSIFLGRCLPRIWLGHCYTTERDPTKQPAPDLFPTATVGDPFASSKLPAAKATTNVAPRRHILPKGLPNAVKLLSDRDLDLMLAAILGEIKRRGRQSPGIETDLQTLRDRFDVRPDSIKKKSAATQQRRTVETEVPLTRGQMNAVRAADKAGITPSRIARQFGLSQSSVWNALKSDKTNR